MLSVNELARDIQMDLLTKIEDVIQIEEASAQKQRRAFNWRKAITSARLKLELEQV